MFIVVFLFVLGVCCFCVFVSLCSVLVFEFYVCVFVVRESVVCSFACLVCFWFVDLFVFLFVLLFGFCVCCLVLCRIVLLLLMGFVFVFFCVLWCA